MFPRLQPAFFRVAACVATLGASSALPGAPVSFADEIRPLFNRHCTSCHGGVKKAGGLSFLFRDEALAAGKSGRTAIVPGKPDESEVVRRLHLSATDEDRMPPEEHGPPLSGAEQALIGRWIAEGAVWQGHWGFEPPQKPAVPTVKNAAWPRSDLDRFILARLEAEGLAPEAEQDRLRWLRRVTLDLTGLPPTAEDGQAFVADTAPTAAERVVDRLLASPHFGERWAALWLDLIRYADSRGLGQDRNREIWKYRDWVIDALNADMPFDAFTERQLAGDLLPAPTLADRIATACHRNTATNDEGGTDDEEFRIEAVVDRVNTTWMAWQGITFGCTQCHAHPYDPFKQSDYYHFLAIFNQTRDTDAESDVPVLRVPLEDTDAAAAEALDREIATLQAKIHGPIATLAAEPKMWSSLTGLTAKASKCGAEVAQTDGREAYRLTGTVPSGLTVTLEAPVPAGLTELTAVRLDALPMDAEKARQLSEWGFVLNDLTVTVRKEGKSVAVPLAHAFSDEPDPLIDPAGSLSAENATAAESEPAEDGNPDAAAPETPETKPATKKPEKPAAKPRAKRSGGWAAFTRLNRPRWGVFVASQAVTVDAGSTLSVVLKFNQSAQGAFPLVIRHGSVALSGDARWLAATQSDAFKAAGQTLSAAKAKRGKMKSTTLPVMAELSPAQQRSTQLFVRGNWMTRGEETPPAIPVSMGRLPGDRPADRLAVARWLTSRENPLTARVLVNRLWEQLFGLGLVETLEDFGSSGEKPSHPELLDWLAVHLRDDQAWSLKQALRELVLSAAYRQDSRLTAEKRTKDPRNRLLSRGPRQRLTAEMMRDQALAVAGLLSTKLHGPPVFPPIPEGVWDPFVGGEKWPVPAAGQENRYRRALYTHVKRSIPFPTASSFDSPSREVCTPRRVNSNTPVQALTLLNDAVFTEAAAALARRMATAGDSLESRISLGYRLTAGHSPEPETVTRLARLHAQTLAHGTPAEAALQNVASVLLNLDEVLTK